MESLRRFIDRLNDRLGNWVSWLSLGLVLLVFWNVLLRYLLNSPSAWLKELEWHLFALLFLLSAGFTWLHNRHVRVDLFYDKMSEADQQTTNRWGVILFLLPWSAVLAYFGWESAMAAYGVGERSPEFDGLSNLWLIQFAIPVGMGLLFMQGVSTLLQPRAREEEESSGGYGAGLLLLAFLAISFVLVYWYPDAFSLQRLSLLLFAGIFILILYGFPVAFTLGGLSLVYALCFLPFDSFGLLPLRIYGIMAREELMAVPLFIFMGIMLERSGLAERLLETMALLFGRLSGGLAVAVVIVGALLAASTGIVGATVITMGLISLPTMLKRGYRTELATGAIAASGTLGQIIPPSIVLILLGSVLNVSVGKLFAAALPPGIILVGAYVLYILVYARVRPEMAPAMPAEEVADFWASNYWQTLFNAFFLPLLLIIAVLGSILVGIASPTEAAAVGAVGALLLTAIERRFNLDVLKSVMAETTHLTSMVFLILLGATTFSLVFRELGGDTYLVTLIEDAQLSPSAFLAVVMILIFLAGFFIDFIEIIFIIVPVVAPIFSAMGVDLIWLGILIALNLQTSFLTPPFGFSLFYLKGVAPPEVTTGHLYRGIIPFIIIQVIVLVLIVLFPEILGWLKQG